MKKKVLLLLTLALLLWALIPSVFATSYTSGDYEYKVDSSGNATITKYTGSASALTIPQSLSGYPVTGIGSYAFRSNQNLTSVVLPKGLLTISGGAFNDCSKLASVFIPKSLESCPYSGAFQNCGALKTVTFEEGTTRIADYLFDNCTGLTEILIPNTVTVVGNGAFQSCDNLKKVTFPGSLTTVEYKAFANCPALLSVELPDSITSIGNGAFENSSFTSLVLPKSLVTLKDGAFANSTKLTSVFIPKSLQDCPYGGPFENCDALNTITFETGTTQIADHLFQNCTGLKELVIPQTVTTIDDYSFKNCVNLKKVTFGPYVTQIGHEAFSGCTALPSISLPANLKIMEGRAFYGCNFTSVELPKGLKELGGEAFGNNGKLTSVFIPKTLEKCPYSGPFTNCGLLNNFIFEEGTTRIASYLFSSCTGLKEMVIPNTVTRIDFCAFDNCPNLKTISIPDSVTVIEGRAFYNCDALVSADLPDGLTKINDALFEDCGSLQSVEIPLDVKEVDGNAFTNCDSLTSIVIPGSVTKFGYYVFENCDNLRNVTLGVNMTEIPPQTFRDCPSLQSLILPFSVKKIGDEAFTNCTGLTEITIPRYTTEISPSAFSYPGMLTIYGVSGTRAESYAQEIGANFVPINKEIQTLTLNMSVLSLEEDNSYRLIPIVTPLDFTDEVQWSSSNTKVASVNESGMVRANNDGTATITFTAGNLSASCVVTVGTHTHNFTEVVVTQPTCTTAGQKKLSCSCGQIKTETIPATGHHYVNGICRDCGQKEPSTEVTNPYNDVSEDKWYYPGVIFAYETGLMNGMGHGTFKPDTEMNRAMLVTVMWRYAGSPVIGTNTFSDVPNDTWYTQAVAWAAHTGIVNGVGNGRFNPDGIITREQLVTLVYRYCTYAGIDTSGRTDITLFPDKNKISSWASEACSWAVAEGLLKGTERNGVVYLDPLGSATRSQVATFFMRMDAYLKE